jgi:hypothetical protein
MTWRNLKGEFQVLNNEALVLKRETRGLCPRWGLLVNRQPLNSIGARADELSDRFAQADTRLAQAGTLDTSINGLIMEAASYAIVSSARESVRTLIHEIYADISDVRGRLDNRVAVILSVAAIAFAAAFEFV